MHSSVWCQKVVTAQAFLMHSFFTSESNRRCTSSSYFKRSKNIWCLIIRPHQGHWWVIWVSEAQRLHQTPTVNWYRLAFVCSVTLHFSPYHPQSLRCCCFWERWETRPWLAVRLNGSELPHWEKVGTCCHGNPREYGSILQPGFCVCALVLICHGEERALWSLCFPNRSVKPIIGSCRSMWISCTSIDFNESFGSFYRAQSPGVVLFEKSL